MKPDPRAHRDFTICDPACGTGGFLVAAYEWLIDADARAARWTATSPSASKSKTYFGQDLVARPAPPGPDEPLPARHRAARSSSATRSTRRPTADRFDVVLTNPPFGTKGANQAPDARRLHRRHQQQAAQLRPARPDHPEARRPGRRRAAGQLPLRRPGRRGLQDPHRGLRPAHRPAPARAARSPRTARASRPTSSSSPRATRPRHVWIYDARTNVPGHHQEGPAADAASTSPSSRSATAPTRTAGPSARPKDSQGRPLALASPSPRSRSATSSSTASSGSRTSRWKTPTTCPSPRNWPPTPSANWRARSRN